LEGSSSSPPYKFNSLSNGTNLNCLPHLQTKLKQYLSSGMRYFVSRQVVVDTLTEHVTFIFKSLRSFLQSTGSNSESHPKRLQSLIRPQGKPQALHSQSNLKSLGQIIKSHILHIHTATSHYYTYRSINWYGCIAPNLIKIRRVRFRPLAI